ncbi:MAG: topoisomerase DNA-binding C4 zinc finger domain-containing protein, partial [Elusimicrobia bacterium]|nr:topoisomerase DNA-binding C4 zinc finger domain-containing protein [Elusimicrobiota bacterium]
GQKIEGSRPLMTTRKCNKCGNMMWLRKGKRGYFLACSGFPKCRNIKPVGKEEGEALRSEGEALRAQMVAQRQAQAGTEPAG